MKNVLHSDTEDRSGNLVPATHMIITEFVSPIQQQLLEQKIRLSNISADTKDQAGLARELRDLRLYELLAEDEERHNPNYTRRSLVTLPTRTSAEDGKEAEDDDDNDKQPGQPLSSACLSRLFGLEELLGDLAEERSDRAVASSDFIANWWFLRQILLSVPAMLPKIARSLVKSLAVAIIGKALSNALMTYLAALFQHLAH